MYRYFLRDFKFISIRESHHAEELSKILNRAVYHTLDPTLLVPREVFEEISSNHFKPIHEKHILFYNLDPGLLPFTEVLEKLLNLPVVIYKSPITIYERLLYSKWLENKFSFYHLGPSDFISLLKHADLVFTNSYHGLALSVLTFRPVKLNKFL
ncbi:MAG: polysaccharide pyruvyl transferase family protein [Saccharolobus sp.]|uniref:polysaccharide pyruvyl transferase family protein n=1 Tax=Saccharolobus sp. TaxID=2100761 RepID=UPI00317E69CA